MPKRLPSVLISAAAGVACLALATPAWAATTPGGDPKGANGTVKIDGVPLDNGVDNEPHDGCDFAVNFFGFDKDQQANIVFTLHQQPGLGTELLRRNDVLGSDDPAGGAKRDTDKTFTFSASELGLSKYTPQNQQGYHIKLTVELPGTPGAGKHKVFWLKPCASSESPSTPPGGGENGGGGGGNGGGESGGAAGSGGLPVTGTAVGSIALLGGAMAAGGAALLFIRRRRDITGAD
jgi:LPXTG-motif cell wall-anchored protein